MANLIPTPRVDKNGRTVIRHMKQEPVQSAPTAPAPMLSQSSVAPLEEATSEQLMTEVVDMAGQAYMTDSAGARRHLEVSQYNLESLQNQVDNRDHILRVHDLFSKALLIAPEKTYDIMEAISYMGFRQNDVLVAHAHQEEFFKATYDLSRMERLYTLLPSHGIIPDPETHRIETLATHVEAMERYNEQIIDNLPPDGSTGFRYWENKVYVKAVEDNAQRIEELFEYRSDMGIIFKDGVDQFDQNHFEDWLAQGVLKDGWL